MNAKKVTEELQRKYPNKNIIKNDPNNPTEIICEIDPTSDHPDYDKAIAVIDYSIPHYHLKSTEEYIVLSGELLVTVDGKEYSIAEGKNLIIKPGQHHTAKGNETWVECISKPGWTPEDHIIIK